MASKQSAQCNPAPKRAVLPQLHNTEILDSHVKAMWILLYFLLTAIETTVVMSLDEEGYWSIETSLRRAKTMVEGVWNIFHGKCPQKPFSLKIEKFQEWIFQFLSSL